MSFVIALLMILNSTRAAEPSPVDIGAVLELQRGSRTWVAVARIEQGAASAVFEVRGNQRVDSAGSLAVERMWVRDGREFMLLRVDVEDAGPWRFRQQFWIISSVQDPTGKVSASKLNGSGAYTLELF